MGLSLDLKLPEELHLEVTLYLGPSFRSTAKDSKPKTLAKRIVKHTQEAFLHNSLGTKFHILPTYIDTWEADQNNLQDFSSAIPEKNLKVGRLHSHLLGDSISIQNRPESHGISMTSSLCGKYSAKHKLRIF